MVKEGVIAARRWREVRRRDGSVEVDVRARVMLCCWFVVFDVT